MILLVRSLLPAGLVIGLALTGSAQTAASPASRHSSATAADAHVGRAGAQAGANETATALQTLEASVQSQAEAITALTQEVRELKEQVGKLHEPPAPPPGPPDTAPPPATGEPVPPPPVPPAEHAEPEPPRAEATGAGIKHIVAKGETLTSIAKHYNIPLADLQKANKNLNDRKMQIGQVLSIPAPPNPESPTPPEKKETP